jgi:hypothetical protein
MKNRMEGPTGGEGGEEIRKPDAVIVSYGPLVLFFLIGGQRYVAKLRVQVNWLS